MRKGHITIFLSFMLVIFLSLILAMIESVRVSGMRMQMETAMDKSIHAVFAEYHIGLLEKYDLFFIDSTYKGDGTGIPTVEVYLKKYLLYNLDPSVDHPQLRTGDWYRFHIDQVTIGDYMLSTDHDLRVLRRQAVRYIQDETDQLPYADQAKTASVLADVEKSGLLGLIDGIEDQIREFDLSTAEEEYGKKIKINNPADEINALRNKDPLELLLQSGFYSNSEVSGALLVTNRTLKQGKGSSSFCEDYSEERADELFRLYLQEKFNDFTETDSDTVLSYEIEYLIHGSFTDSQNLGHVVEELIHLREKDHAEYLRACKSKKDLAHEAAILATDGVEIPVLTDLIEESILYAWGYAEAIIDVSMLLSGQSVPAKKTDVSWKLSLENLLLYPLCMHQTSEEGLLYEDYLNYYLSKENSSTVRRRGADLIELNMRKRDQNDRFCMDQCLEQMGAKAEMSSEYGYEYFIIRDFGYEKITNER